MEGFGQTETTMLIGNIKGMTPRPGSMGKPSPLYEVAVMLSDGSIAKTGEEGEIVVKVADGVPNGLFTGYYNDKEKPIPYGMTDIITPVILRAWTVTDICGMSDVLMM